MSKAPIVGEPPRREHIPAHFPEAYPDGPNEKFDRDINLKVILYTGFGLAAISAVAIVLMWFMSSAFRNASIASDRPPSPMIEANQPVLPPGPRLQGAPGSAFEEQSHAPELELRQLRDEEKERLDGFGYVSEEGGTAHIPIERAMAILASRSAASEGSTGEGEGADAAVPAPAGHRPMARTTRPYRGEIPPAIAALERASGRGMGTLPPGAETVTLDGEAGSLTAGDPTETNPLDVPAPRADEGGEG